MALSSRAAQEPGGVLPCARVRDLRERRLGDPHVGGADVGSLRRPVQVHGAVGDAQGPDPPRDLPAAVGSLRGLLHREIRDALEREVGQVVSGDGSAMDREVERGAPLPGPTMYAKQRSVVLDHRRAGPVPAAGRRGHQVGPLVRLPGELRSETRALLEDQAVVDGALWVRRVVRVDGPHTCVAHPPRRAPVGQPRGDVAVGVDPAGVAVGQLVEAVLVRRRARVRRSAGFRRERRGRRGRRRSAHASGRDEGRRNNEEESAPFPARPRATLQLATSNGGLRHPNGSARACTHLVPNGPFSFGR